MTVARAMLVLCMLMATGIAIVALRGESAKTACRIQRLHQRQLTLEQTLWAHEMELARLRGPDEIRRRAGKLGLDVVPPTGRPNPNLEVTGN